MSDLYGDDIVLWPERQAGLLRRFAPSIRQRRDPAGICTDALEGLAPVPDVCPVTLDELLGEP